MQSTLGAARIRGHRSPQGNSLLENIVNYRVSFAIALLLACLGSTASAEVRLPKVLGSQMVIQRGQPATIWGWAKEGEKVVVEMEEARAETVTGSDGRWSLKIDPPAVGGP